MTSTYPLEVNARTVDGTALRVVYLPHQPDDADKIVTLRAEIAKNGWQGRPVILADAGDHHIALTGCHRLAAAQALDDVIRAVYLPDDLSCEDWDEIDGANDDDDLLAALETIADGRETGEMDDVIAAMHAEVDANNAS